MDEEAADSFDDIIDCFDNIADVIERLDDFEWTPVERVGVLSNKAAMSLAEWQR